MARAKISKEEKKKIIAEYKTREKELLLKEKAEEKERAAFEKAKTPEQKKEEAEAKKKADEENKRNDKAKALADKQAKEKARIETEFENYRVKHQAEVSEKRTALESRYDLGAIIHLFFFNIGQSKFCQGYMNWWRKLQISHPGLSKWLYQIFFFIVFSEGVTIWQFLLMLFLPNAFSSLSGTAFVWPQVHLWTWNQVGFDGATDMIWGIFNEPVVYKNGVIQVNGGLGNFIAYEIAVFTAQCINFPLQRNITYKSHGNPWYQAMWYFIGWVLMSLFCNAIWGFINPMLLHSMDYNGGAAALYSLIKTVLTGGISMIIFFFIFRIIFPAGADTTAKDDNPKATVSPAA
jgi:flagellar motor protein MotB